VKHLKSSLSDLRRLFERTVTIRDIAEPLVSFDSDHEASAVRRFMSDHSFDIVGIREHGHVRGYVVRTELSSGRLSDHIRDFSAVEVVADTEPLTSAFTVLRERKQVFVTMLGRVGAVVARADLQKAPVRMWLFGLISLTEMHMQRLIREAFPTDEWQQHLSPDRLLKSQRLHANKQARNVETDLTDCLEWGDKATIFRRTPKLIAATGLASPTQAKQLFGRLEVMRNDLSHASDIIQGRWPELADRAQAAEALLQRLEKAILR
jgi:predicted transcriptional regulator